MKPVYSCIATMVMILAGAAIFRPQMMTAGSNSVATVNSGAVPPASAEQKMYLAENYGKLPLSFEANQGQTDGRVKFLSRGQGYSLFLTGDEAVLRLARASQKSNRKSQNANVKARLAPPAARPDMVGRSANGIVAQHPLFGAAAFPGLLSLSLPKEKPDNHVEKPRDRRAGPALPFSSRLGESGECSTVLRMRLLGANTSAAVTGADELPGKSNYFIGNDPKKWRTNVPNYTKVKYQNVYPGVDLVYYGNQSGQLEYDFVVAAGAGSSAIKLDVGAGLALPRNARSARTGSDMSERIAEPTKGAGQAQPLRIGTNGDLVVKVDGGEVRFNKPLVYQEPSEILGPSSPNQLESRSSKMEIRGPEIHQTSIDHRQLLDGRFVLDAQNRVHFALGAYDHTRPLVIDPVLTYSTYLGGNDSDSAVGIAVDSSGNAYVAGDTSSTNFPTVNPVQGNLEGGTNIFVTKMNAQGSALVYSTYLGGSSAAGVSALAVDTSGNAYVSGLTSSPNFPTVNALQPSLESSTNLFLAKLSAEGSSLVYSTYLGGSAINQSGNPPVDGVAADAAGNAYVVGNTTSEDFVTTPGAYRPNCPEPFDFRACVADYVLKVSADGSSLLYSTFVGGANWYTSGAITADAAGNAYVTAAAYDPTSPNPGFTEVFKINPQGTGLVYDTGIFPVDYIEATSINPSGIAIDPAGNAYVIGSVNFNRLPATPGAFQTSCMPSSPDSCQTGFVTKFDGNGNIVYSTYLGASDGSGGVFPTAIAADPNGNAYVVGGAGPNLPLLNPFVATPPSGGTFLTVLNPTGTGLVYSSYSFTNTSSIAVDASSNAYLTGGTGSTDLPVTPGAFQTSLAGVIDAFLAKVSPLTPGANVAPSDLTFGNEEIGSSSSPMLVTLSDTGTAPLTVNSIAVSGDFTQTNNCGSSVSPASSCTIDVYFAPSATGTRTGTLTVTDNSNGLIGGQQTVSLSGTGLSGAASISPLSLAFSNWGQGATSWPLKVTLTNAGTAPLPFLGATFTGANPGDFAQTNNCPVDLAPGSSCNLRVTFMPSTLGAETATLNVNDNAVSSPQTVALSGTGTPPVLLGPSAAGFGNVAKGAPSRTAIITLANAQSVALNISSIALSNPDFTQTNTCDGSLAPRTLCTVSVTFTPSILGLETATLTVNDSASNTPQIVSLAGTGK